MAPAACRSRLIVRGDDLTSACVAVEECQAINAGCHAINRGMINVDGLVRRPRGAPDHGELPVLFLGQVAVSISAWGHGVASIRVHHVFEKACRIAEEAGCFAIVLDVMSDAGEAPFRGT